jgi:hypothetical protein
VKCIKNLNSRIGAKASIDCHSSARHKLGGITAKPMQGAQQIIWISKSIHRGMANDLVSTLRETSIYLGKKGSVLFSEEKSWSQGVHSEAWTMLGGKFDSKPFGEVVDGSFG